MPFFFSLASASSQLFFLSLLVIEWHFSCCRYDGAEPSWNASLGSAVVNGCRPLLIGIRRHVILEGYVVRPTVEVKHRNLDDV
uniref:Putative secreted protein n=1 Tax=Anopheles triannulatus TaxID=58253 RepID=A0A2M4B159_9DIPT